MSARKRAAGFSLLELVIAMSISTIVLLGIFSISSSMVQSEVNSMRSGTVTSWTLLGVDAMNTNIAGAGALFSANNNILTVCTNWSMLTGAQVVPGVPTAIYSFCYDTTDTAPYANTLIQNVVPNAGACAAVVTNCAYTTVSGIANSQTSLIATGVYQNTGAPAPPIFQADPHLANTVDVQFTVGDPNAGVSAGSNGTTNTTVPQTVTFNTKIVLED